MVFKIQCKGGDFGESIKHRMAVPVRDDVTEVHNVIRWARYLREIYRP